MILSLGFPDAFCRSASTNSCSWPSTSSTTSGQESAKQSLVLRPFAWSPPGTTKATYSIPFLSSPRVPETFGGMAGMGRRRLRWCVRNGCLNVICMRAHTHTVGACVMYVCMPYVCKHTHTHTHTHTRARTTQMWTAQVATGCNESE